MLIGRTVCTDVDAPSVRADGLHRILEQIDENLANQVRVGIYHKVFRLYLAGKGHIVRYQTQPFNLPQGDGTEYYDCTVSFDEAKGELRLKSDRSSRYAFILRNMPAVSSVKDAVDWQYDAERKELLIVAEGKDISLQID